MEHFNTQQEVAVQEKREVEGKQMIDLLNVEEYKAFMREFRGKISELVNEGLMSDEVGNRVLNEFSYNTFNAIVKVNVTM